MLRELRKCSKKLKINSKKFLFLRDCWTFIGLMVSFFVCVNLFFLWDFVIKVLLLGKAEIRGEARL